MMGESNTETSMIVEDECNKKNADSPALTEATSYTSSPESSPQDESKINSIRRNLFKMDVDKVSPKETIDSPGAFRSPSPGLGSREGVLTPSVGEHGLADTTSITSSETTAIPSWNLSTKDAAEKNVEVPLDQFVLSQPVPLMSSPPYFPLDRTQPILSSPSSFASDATQPSDASPPQLLGDEIVSHSSKRSDEKEDGDVRTKQPKLPSMVMEDPPEEQPTSCTAAMNLAEIVFAFGQSARQRYQGSEQPGAATDDSNPEIPSPNKEAESTNGNALVGSPPPIMTSRHLSESSSQSDKSQTSFLQSIERERDTLKSNSKRDAFTISKLQQAVDTQKQLNSLKELEMVDKQAEIQVLENRIRTLQKEQEDYLERETELRETIKILKRELDKMTLLKTVPSDELDQSKLELEPSSNELETDNVNKEVKLAEFRAKEQQARIVELESSVKEKEKENFDLQTKIDWLNDQYNKGGKDEQHKEANAIGISENEEIGTVLKDIMKRLEAVEIEKNEKESRLTKKPKDNTDEKIESGRNGVAINVLEDPDAIEAMNLKGKAEKVDKGEKIEDSINPSTWCCDWN